jgi:Na+-translocating ferredoxin:NAD+ oxidoreductase RnfD subunit
MISMQFIIFSTSKYWNEAIFDYYYYQFKLKYRINSFLMQELKLYMAQVIWKPYKVLFIQANLFLWYSKYITYNQAFNFIKFQQLGHKT